MFDLIPSRGRGANIQRRGYDELNKIWNMMDSFFDNSFGTLVSNYHPIRADVMETENEYVIDAELPGVKKEDVALNVVDNRLVITVVQNEEKNEKSGNYIRRERRSGTSSRSFYLENIKEEEIKAKFHDGVLSITLPKEKPDKPKEKIIAIE